MFEVRVLFGHIPPKIDINTKNTIVNYIDYTHFQLEKQPFRSFTPVLSHYTTNFQTQIYLISTKKPLKLYTVHQIQHT